MNRRDFLKRSLITSLCTALAGCRSMNKSAEHIIVIGSGIAGLAAARTLQDAGHRVTIIEARDRIGGRIWTSQLWPNKPLDLGASWIHGVNGNPISSLAETIGAETIPTNYDSAVLYDADGTLVSGRRWAMIESESNAIISAANQANLGNGSDDYTLQAAIEATTDWDSLSVHKRQQITYYLNTLIEHEFAADMAELSGKNWDDSDAFCGGDVIFPQGYAQISTFLAQGLNIQLSQTVQQIEYNNQGVVITTSKEQIEGDRAVVTLPLGVLKQNFVVFSPRLPDDKQDAIETLGMGLLNKTYLQFSEPFWPQEPQFLEHISVEKGEWAEWFNISHFTDAPILLGFNAGTYGRWLESLQDEEVVAEATAVLRTIYGSSIPEPTGWQITRWATDPFAFGSYSFNAVGASWKTREQLAQPVADRLFFAGEATSVEYPSTVHGAYLSGIREAERIIRI